MHIPAYLHTKAVKVLDVKTSLFAIENSKGI